MEDSSRVANSLPPGFQGIDFSQWGGWTPTTIDGLPYYQIPGHDQYVFDPYDGAYGSIKINPQYVQKAYDKEHPQPGIVDQVVPAGGLIGGLYLAKHFFGPTSSAAADTTSSGLGSLFGSGAAESGSLGAETASEALGYGGNSAGFMGSSFAPGAESTGIENAGILSSAAPYLGLAGAGVGAYGLSQAIGHDDVKGGALSGAGLGLGLGAAAPLVGLGPLGWGALGLMALGGAGAGAGLTSLFGHKTTRQLAQEHTKSLLSQGKEDPAWQSYVSGMRQQYGAPPPDKEHPFAGKYKTWEEYEANGLEAPDLTGVRGNLKTFGPDWAHLTEDQRIAVTQGIINAGLYKSKKGEVEITDPTQAKSIYDSVVGGSFKPELNKTNLSTGGNVKKQNINLPMPNGVMHTPMSVPQRPGYQPTNAIGGAPSFGQSIANQVSPSNQRPPMMNSPAQRPMAQPGPEADWLMRMRQNALMPQMQMNGQGRPFYQGR